VTGYDGAALSGRFVDVPTPRKPASFDQAASVADGLTADSRAD
jgi:hypothetical protein